MPTNRNPFGLRVQVAGKPCLYTIFRLHVVFSFHFPPAPWYNSQGRGWIKLNFSEIKLTRQEVKILKCSINKTIEITSAPRLLRFGFVQEIFVSNQGGKPIGTGKAKISDSGRDFLIYRKDRFVEKWVPYWITTSIAVIALIVSIVSIFISP